MIGRIAIHVILMYVCDCVHGWVHVYLWLGGCVCVRACIRSDGRSKVVTNERTSMLNTSRTYVGAQ